MSTELSTTAPEPLAEVRPGQGDAAATLQAARVRIPGTDVELGPLGHLAAERHRLAGLRFDSFDVIPQSATVGAEVTGLDLTRPLTDAQVADVQAALGDFKVLFFRDQPITPQRHVALARHFGELEIHPFIAANPDHPELVRFAKSADVAGYENGWHHDVTWREAPSKAALLHAIEVPPTGGDTLFADMVAAYEGLDEATRDRIDGLVAVHDHALAFGHLVSGEEAEAMRATYPPVEHPVVGTHDDTGRRYLYVNRFFTSHIVGLEPDESQALLDRLCRQADIVEYQCRFRWARDSVAIWDNRAVQHYAASDYWPDVRVMERASVVGARPR